MLALIASFFLGFIKPRASPPLLFMFFPGNLKRFLDTYAATCVIEFKCVFEDDDDD